MTERLCNLQAFVSASADPEAPDEIEAPLKDKPEPSAPNPPLPTASATPAQEAAATPSPADAATTTSVAPLLLPANVGDVNSA